MRPPCFADGAGFLFARPLCQFEHASDRFLDRQVAGGPDVAAPLGEKQVDFRRPAPDPLDPGEFGDGFLVVARKVGKVQFAAGHQFAQAARIALFLARQAAGAQRIEIARQQFVRGHGFAQFGFELGPHRIRRCDADLLADDRPQQRAVTGGAHAFLGITATLQRAGNHGVGRRHPIEVSAQLCVGQPHGECACLPRRD